jgi:uncharacterized protein YgiM (DUF1202 family)
MKSFDYICMKPNSMKHIIQFACVLTLSIFLSSCGSETASPEKSAAHNDSLKKANEDASKGLATLSIMEGQGLRESFGDKGKWVTALSFGEEVKLTADTASDDKGKSWVRVDLKDGKTSGWVEKKYLAEKAQLAVMVDEAELHSRPNMTNNTDTYVKSGKLIVVRQTIEGNWSEVVAPGAKYNWGERGWIMGSGIYSTNSIDIEVAERFAKAMAEANITRKIEKLEAILNKSEYENSIFLTAVQVARDEMAEEPELGEGELMVTGDNVNLRKEPNTTSEKVMVLPSGEVGKIIETGEVEEINGVTDLWYKISIGEKEGWIFGAFTSRAK